MNIPIETINSFITFFGGVFALLAAIVTAVTTLLPKEKAVAAMESLRAKIIGFVTTLSAIVSPFSVVTFGSLRVALFIR